MSFSWAQDSARERGSFSTLASVSLNGQSLSISMIGDSSVILLARTRIIKSIPYDSERQFSSALSALWTGSVTGPDGLKVCTGSAKILKQVFGLDMVILATDAVACWMLCDDPRERRQRTRRIRECRAPSDFHELVVSERTHHRMKIDDSTVVILGVTETQDSGES